MSHQARPVEPTEEALEKLKELAEHYIDFADDHDYSPSIAIAARDYADDHLLKQASEPAPQSPAEKSPAFAIAARMGNIDVASYEYRWLERILKLCEVQEKAYQEQVEQLRRERDAWRSQVEATIQSRDLAEEQGASWRRTAEQLQRELDAHLQELKNAYGVIDCQRQAKDAARQALSHALEVGACQCPVHKAEKEGL